MTRRDPQRALAFVLAAGLLGGAAASAQEKMGQEGHAFSTPKTLKWADAPASLPKGAKVAVLEGDPSKPGPFTLRLQMPANYRIAPHYHPAIEHVTVISGTFNIGMGEKADRKKGTTLPAGSFAVIQPETRHFAWTSGPTVIQLHGIGPWGLTYVNPADDPRNTKLGDTGQPATGSAPQRSGGSQPMQAPASQR
ncbi:MAG TPA: cupin domain-containing protein [Thermodesulfobacteriota bacterium]|nr:cupin domain-containing protein [Thermodesulfobacteriota bacterium]